MKARLLVYMLMLAVLVSISGAVLAGDTVKSIAKSNVLFLVGGPFHDNPALYPIMQKMLDDLGHYTMTLSRDVDQFKPENIKKYDLVISYSTRLTMNKEQEQGLVNFIESGKGLVAIHCGVDTFRDSDAYWKLVGGRFFKHGHELFKVNITGKSHPIVKGLSDFEINDESYCDEFSPESKCIVLARRDKDSEPSVWVQYYGKGRVFVTGLGHDKVAWDNPTFQELVKRGCEWATFRLNP